MSRTDWHELRDQRLSSALAQIGYDEAATAFELGSRVRDLRERHQLTQAELALRMGTTQSVIARLEAGGSIPRIATLRKVASAVGATLVVGFTETPVRRAAARH